MINYPQTKRLDVLEVHFGQTINDPYRWLENDARSDEEVAIWVTAQNKMTRAHLDKLPGRGILKTRLKELIDYEKFTIPIKKGSRYFYLRNTGVQNQLSLFVRDSMDGEGRMVIDPNSRDKDGATALAEWSASGDGSRVAYAVMESGSDWRTIRVLDVNTGTVLIDRVKWARFTTIEWAKDRSGFFYARFPEPVQSAAPHAGVENHAVYFHAIGTEQDTDRLVFATLGQVAMVHSFSITQDGRYLAICSTSGSTLGNTLTVVDLTSADWKPQELFKKLD